MRVLSAMKKIPRHLFVEEALQDQAYRDHALPIGARQTISQPFMVAFMTEALALSGKEKVLEIGMGSGYQTAILAELAAEVISIERLPVLIEKARAILDQFHYENVRLQLADGSIGWEKESSFDAILVAAGAPEIPQALVDQLDIGGRLVIPVGGRSSQVLKKIVKEKYGTTETALTHCAFVPLIGASGWQSAKSETDASNHLH